MDEAISLENVTCSVCRQEFNTLDGARGDGTADGDFHWFTPTTGKGKINSPFNIMIPGSRESRFCQQYEDLPTFPGDGQASPRSLSKMLWTKSCSVKSA